MKFLSTTISVFLLSTSVFASDFSRTFDGGVEFSVISGSAREQYFNREQSTDALNRAYRAVLQRRFSEQEHRRDYPRVYRYGLSGLRDVIYDLTTSPEFRRNILQRQSDDQILHAYYRGFLHRNPDRDGYHHYMRMLRDNRHVFVAEDIGTSPEFVDRVLYGDFQ